MAICGLKNVKICLTSLLYSSFEGELKITETKRGLVFEYHLAELVLDAAVLQVHRGVGHDV